MLFVLKQKSLNHYLAKNESEQTEEKPIKLKIESLSNSSKSDTKQSIQLKQIDLNEITKLLWIKLSRSDLASLIKDAVDNLDKKDYQTKINNDNYDLTNVEQVLLEKVTKKISKNEALKLYENPIEPKAVKLVKAKGRGKDKRNNILDNIKSIIFEGRYFHYDSSKPKTTEKSISERRKLRRQRLDMVKEKEKKHKNEFFSYYFNYSSPRNMLSRLCDVSSEINAEQVYSIIKTLTKIKYIVKNVTKDDPLKTEENELKRFLSLIAKIN